MSDSPTPMHERLAILAEADELFTHGVDADNAGEWSNFGPRECWEEAVHAFNSAAVKYRDLGLGLKAREAWSRSAECHRKIAGEHLRFAKHCEEDRDAVEVHWDGEGNTDG